MFLLLENKCHELDMRVREEDSVDEGGTSYGNHVRERISSSSNWSSAYCDFSMYIDFISVLISGSMVRSNNLKICLLS